MTYYTLYTIIICLYNNNNNNINNNNFIQVYNMVLITGKCGSVLSELFSLLSDDRRSTTVNR